MINVRFSSDVNGHLLSAVEAVLLGPRLMISRQDYPGHEEWVSKAYAEVKNEQKRAIVAWDGQVPVGLVIYQRHKVDNRAVEIKNLTVDPRYGNRYLASFLLRNAEREAYFNDFVGVRYAVADLKANNYSMILFVRKHHYYIQEQSLVETQFEHNGYPDLVIRKDLQVLHHH